MTGDARGQSVDGGGPICDPLSTETGLRFGPATRIGQVEAAWTLVYRSYLAAGLIQPNPWQLHTEPAALHHETLVAIGQIDRLVVATVSAFVDDGRPLPMDRVCPPAMQDLRDAGRRVMQVDLLADRREKLSMSLSALMELMRLVFFYALHGGVDDIVISVDRRHARFYRRCFGFAPLVSRDQAHDPKPTISSLRLDLQTGYHQADQLPSGLAFFVEGPLDAATYDRRYRFDRSQVEQSSILPFLNAGQSSTP